MVIFLVMLTIGITGGRKPLANGKETLPLAIAPTGSSPVNALVIIRILNQSTMVDNSMYMLYNLYIKYK